MSDSMSLFVKLNEMEKFYDQILDKHYEMPIIDVSELTVQDAAKELKDLNVHFSHIDKEELKKLDPGERIKVYEQIQKIREYLMHSILESGSARPKEVKSMLFGIFDKSRLELLAGLKALLAHSPSSPGKSNLKKKSVKNKAGSQMAGLNTLENYLNSIKLEGEPTGGGSVSIIYPRREIKRREKFHEDDFPGEYIVRHGMKTLSLVNKELDYVLNVIETGKLNEKLEKENTNESIKVLEKDKIDEFNAILKMDKNEIVNQIQTTIELIDRTFVSQSNAINEKHSKYLFYNKSKLKDKLGTIKNFFEGRETLEKPENIESPKEPEKLDIPKKQAPKKSVKFDVPEEPEVRMKEETFDLTIEDTLTMLENLMQKIRTVQ